MQNKTLLVLPCAPCAGRGQPLGRDQLPSQILIPPESTLHLQLVVVMDKHLLDDELAPTFMMLQTLDQGHSHSPTLTGVKCSGGLQFWARTILLR
jgi:hypothetical protein